MSNSLWRHELLPARLHCPWDFPSKNTGVSCHFFLQEIFLTQESNPRLLHWCNGRWILSHWAIRGFPWCSLCFRKAIYTIWALYSRAATVAQLGKSPPANAGEARNKGSIPGSGRSSGEGNSNPLQYSCLENPMNRGAWRDTVQGFTKSWMQLTHAMPKL